MKEGPLTGKDALIIALIAAFFFIAAILSANGIIH